MTSQGELRLPHLEVLATETVVLHEDSDERRVAGMAHRFPGRGLDEEPADRRPDG